MYRSEKKQLISLLQTFAQALSYYGETGDAQYLPDCVQGLQTVDTFLKEREPNYQPEQVQRLTVCLKRLQTISEPQMLDEASALLEQLYQQLLELPCKLKMLFLPYVSQMWTALESIWKAAYDDPDCEALVVPIPYHELKLDDDDIPRVQRLIYEGLQYPSYVPVCDYRTLNLDTLQPDAIFIHNPYDDNNNLTRVPEEYFSSSLREKTDCLVYSTYGILNVTRGFPHPHADYPAYQNADLILQTSELESEILQQSGIPAERILAVGSPKLDHIVRPIRPPVIPQEWQEKFAGRHVFLLNTHLTQLFLTGNCMDQNGRTKTFLPGVIQTEFIIRHLLEREGCALLWRPHPLLEQLLENRGATQILKIIRGLKMLVQSSSQAVLDTQTDYLPAFMASDAFLTTASSMVNEYLVTCKPVYELSGSFRSSMEDHKFHFEGQALDMRYIYYQDDFLHLFSDDPWPPPYETQKRECMCLQRFVDMVEEGRDPLKAARMEAVGKAFLNSGDGSCGLQTYTQIKKQLLDAL